MVGSESALPVSLPQRPEYFERVLIEQAPAATRGSIKALLAVPRKTLYDRMRKYGLDKIDYKG